MAASKPQADFVRKELDLVLASPGFVRNERLSRFLRFVVDRQMEGREDELKESVLGVEVFGRKPGFDPQQDSVVRSEAARLRARLAEYYAGEGSADPVVIELPKGGYTPRFRAAEISDRKTRRTRMWPMAALTSLAVIVAAGAWEWIEHKSAPIAIAVLPLENLSRDPANDYFSDGLTDELIRNLSSLDGLSVRSQTSSFSLKGKPHNIREAGKLLQVDYIVEGAVLRAGQRLRINAQLVRVRDDFALWSGRFDRELTDVLVIQDEISGAIVNSLRLKLGRGRRRYETSVEAHDLYLRARALEIQLGYMGYRQSIGPFEEAIAKDPSFAPAYAGLAAAYAVNSAQGFRTDHAGELKQMRSAAEKAITLDPLLAEAHDALAMEYARDGQWEQAERSFRRAIELDPSDSMTYGHASIFLLLPLGRIEHALRYMRIAEKNDPLSPYVHGDLAVVLISAGRYDEAAALCQNLPESYSGKSELMGRIRLGQGRTNEAIQIFVDAGDRKYIGYAYGRARRREEAEKQAVSVAPNAFFEALTFAGLGDKDRTLDALQRMAPLGAVRIGRALHSPEFALLSGDGRVKQLKKLVGLPE